MLNDLKKYATSGGITSALNSIGESALNNLHDAGITGGEVYNAASSLYHNNKEFDEDCKNGD